MLSELGDVNMHPRVKTRRAREREKERETLMISAEVEENTIPCKTVYTGTFMSQLEVRDAEITPRLNIKPVVVGV